jgi:hypothetical protein
MLGHGLDGDHGVVGTPRHNRGKGVVHHSIVTDGPTEGDGPIDLFSGRDDGFELFMLNRFRFWQRRWETCEVSVNFGGHGGRFWWWE